MDNQPRRIVRSDLTAHALGSAREKEKGSGAIGSATTCLTKSVGAVATEETGPANDPTDPGTTVTGNGTGEGNVRAIVGAQAETGLRVAIAIATASETGSATVTTGTTATDEGSVETK